MEENLTSAELVSQIDISSQSRLLGLLRLTDYTSVMLCVGWLVFTLQDLSQGGKDVGFSTLLRGVVLALAVYVGWRHLGAIDLYFWQSHLFTLIALVTLCTLVVSTSWDEIFSPQARMIEMRILENRAMFLAYISVVVIVGVVSLVGTIALIVLVNTRINSKNVFLVDLLTKVSTPNSLSEHSRIRIARISLSRGVLTAIIAAAILLGIALVPWPKPEYLGRFIFISNYFAIFAYSLLVRSRQYLQFDADSLLSADTRDPILLLRSFEDDERVEYAASKQAALDYSLETRLATHFVRTGPFIAVGAPGESVPLPGAARKVLSDTEWQEQVIKWTAAAAVVLMYAGKTRWLNWELRKVIELGKTSKLILMTPESMIRKSASEVDARIKNMTTAFSETKWAPALTALPASKSIRALTFKPDGSVVAITSRWSNRDSWHLASLIAHYIVSIEPKNRDGGNVLKP